MSDYLQALQIEIKSQSPACEVDTLYFGGGTPSQLPGEAFDRLGDLALQWRPLTSGYEWTVEANPADVTPGWITQLASRGVTRLSLGGQSFHGPKLRLLERDHTVGDIQRSAALARETGIDVCLDLIFASPGETLDQWRADLAAALALEPEHISTYGLTFERGTSFWSRRAHGAMTEVDEDVQREMYVTAIDALTAAGYEHYEVSNFALPGHRSRHNQAYWAGYGYWAIGPGATRYVDGVRETNHRSTFTYLKRVLVGESPVAEREQLDPVARAREALVLGLRRLTGVAYGEFEQETGFTIKELAGPAIARFITAGLLTDDANTIRLTREGLLVSDAIWPDLL